MGSSPQKPSQGRSLLLALGDVVVPSCWMTPPPLCLKDLGLGGQDKGTRVALGSSRTVPSPSRRPSSQVGMVHPSYRGTGAEGGPPEGDGRVEFKHRWG